MTRLAFKSDEEKFLSKESERKVDGRKKLKKTRRKSNLLFGCLGS